MWETESLSYPRYSCNWLSCLITNVSAQPIYSGLDFPCLSFVAVASNIVSFQGPKGEREREEKREGKERGWGGERERGRRGDRRETEEREKGKWGGGRRRKDINLSIFWFQKGRLMN